MILLLALAAAAADPTVRAQEALAETQSLISNVEVGLVTRELTCAAPQPQEAEVKLASLRGMSSGLSAGEARAPTYLRAKYSAAGRLLAEFGGNLHLDLASAYLRAGCLNEADRVYREVLKSSDETVRDRALAGLDDVRAKRQ